MIETPVKFLNKESQQLSGIVHVPNDNPKGDKQEGVIFIGRISYGRQYVYYARRLCEEGFHVLRFDSHGIGDSEGSIPTCPWATFWSQIQTGFFIDDVVAAIDFFNREANIRSITLISMCGGAVSALLTAGKDRRVDSLILIGMPVLVDDISVDYQGRMPVSYYRSHLTQYARKVASFESWKRFLTRRTNYNYILRLASIWLKKEFRKQGQWEGKAPIELEALSDPGRPDFNRYILTSFINFADRGKRTLFIYGANDATWKEFQAELRARYLPQNGKYWDAYEVHTIENGNHLLSQRKWQDIVIDKIIYWLSKYQG